MPNYYDDQKQLIATNTAELVLYFQSLNGSMAAYEVPVTLACPATAVIQVKSTGIVPKFLYVDGVQPNNKIYPQLLEADTLDLAPLCNGVTDSNIVAPPDCGTVVCYVFVLDAPDCGTVVFVSGYDEEVILTPNSGGGWALYGDIKSYVDINGVVTLNVSVINSGITISTLFVAEHILSVALNGRVNNPFAYQSTNHPNMPDNSTLDITAIGGGVLRYSGYETSFSAAGAVIEIYNVQYNKNN